VNLVLFDIDGTLLTSMGTGRSAVTEALSEVCGKSISPDGIEFAGRTDPQIMADMLAAAGISIETRETIFEACLEAYKSVLMRRLTPDRIRLCPGVAELIHHLSGRADIALGLLTGNLRETAYLKLHAAGLGSKFTVGGFGSDSPQRRDLPSTAVERASQFFSASFGPTNTVVVGDTPSDIDCARHYGARVIAVATGTYSIDELSNHAPDLLINDLTERDRICHFISSS